MSQEELNNNEMEQSNLDAARKLIEAVRLQFAAENEKIMEYKREIYRERDFKITKFATYEGPNLYLDRKALVFNVFIAPIGDSVAFFKEHIQHELPRIAEIETPYVVDLFAEVVLEVLRMDINLYINKYAIDVDGDEYVIATEFLDKKVAKKCVHLVSDWFYAMTNDKVFNFKGEWIKLQAEFDKTFYGGPTLYSLIEAGLKRDIPVFYLYEENQFQWGYGIKQLRGRSTTFSTDGIKDTEFTMYKDMCADFLNMCGFPTPQGLNVFTEEDAVLTANKLGYPCVVKPVNGHKGQGVTTGILTESEVRKAFKNIISIGTENNVPFEGALVQTQVYGTDHRLLAVNGKFAAALERVPAFVIGNGQQNIEELIIVENELEIRLDNARSPLCKIKIDEDLKDFLKLQGKSLLTVPDMDERIELRRVANISAGGVSINVTDKIHPDNIKLVEDIASYLNVRCLGIDALAEDISKSWREGNFGIIEINAGPGVFMHLAPAYGGSIDVPGMIIMSHFEKPENSRIPIIAGNKISQELEIRIRERIQELKPKLMVGSLLNTGVHFNGVFFHKNIEHVQNVKIMLRKPQLGFAIFCHELDDIYDYGIMHQGADAIIMEDAQFAEDKVLGEQLFPACPRIDITDGHVDLLIDGTVIESRSFSDDNEKDEHIFSFLNGYLPDMVHKYDL